MCFFSIILPTYNRAGFLPAAIESVLRQTISDWELIIVDDGSTDNTKEIVNAFCTNDSRIKYFFQENSERSVARNNGIKQSNGEFICCLDSDCSMLPDRLEFLKNEINGKNKPDAFFFTDIKYENNDGFDLLKKGKPLVPFSYDLLNEVLIATPQVCIKRTILEKIQFNPELTIGEDHELWFRIAEKYPIFYLDGAPTIIEKEHPGRSVNLKTNNSALKQLKSLDVMFSKNHPARNISRKQRNVSKSNVYFNVAKHYMYNNKKLLSLKFILLSLQAKPIHPKSRHKLFCLFSLVLKVKVKEYHI